ARVAPDQVGLAHHPRRARELREDLVGNATAERREQLRDELAAIEAARRLQIEPVRDLDGPEVEEEETDVRERRHTRGYALDHLEHDLGLEPQRRDQLAVAVVADRQRLPLRLCALRIQEREPSDVD